MFDIYGIGNALVDFEFEVSDATLVRLNIEKGAMMLIDEHREHFLLEELSGIKHAKSCGGSAANTVMTVQQLGGQGFYCCKVADDQSGRFFCDALSAAGVHTNMNNALRVTGDITGKCIAMITPDGQRSMNTFLGCTANLSCQEFSAEPLTRSRYLYLEGYVVSSDIATAVIAEAMRVAAKHGVQIVLSLSDLNVVRYARPKLETVLQHGIDILFANQAEALLFTGCSEVTAAALALGEQARLVIISQGEHGAMAYDGREMVGVEAHRVQVLDTLGAGDVFAGAVLFALSRGVSLRTALDIGCFAAAQVITSFGSRLRPAALARTTEYMRVSC